MARKKPAIHRDIQEATNALRDVMQTGLASIAGNMISQIMGRVRNATDTEARKALKDVQPKGIAEYRTNLLAALAIIAKDALDAARKEVPSKKNVKLAGEDESIQLGEFENLPAKIRSRILSKAQLLVDTQIGDIEKSVFFQFQSSIDSTDSDALIEDDLMTAAEDVVSGASVSSGAAATASDVVNSVRLAFFIDDTVQEQIDAFQFTNGDPVSAICTELDGTVFSADDPNLNRYWPPLHWNCKSYILPILKGNMGRREIEKLDPSKTAQRSIQFGTQCGCGSLKFGEADSLRIFKNSQTLKRT